MRQMDLDENDELFNKSIQKSSDIKAVERKDISLDKKVYQCSTVDDRVAQLAISPPYDSGGTRTRREADPWWEIDLGKTHCIHSVSCTAIGTIQQKLHLYVLVLPGPVGFENPFLDKVIPLSREWKEFVFDECSTPTEHNVEFILPENTFGGSVRFQIRGVQVLRLVQCHVFQGDHLPPRDPSVAQALTLRKLGFDAPVISYDEIVRITSFAAQPLSIFDDIKKERQNQPQKSETTTFVDSRTKEKNIAKHVSELTSRLQIRKNRIDWWRERAEESANYFSLDELVAIRDILFGPVASGPRHGKRSPTKVMISLQDLRGGSLIQHYPRCGFDDFIKQLKKITEWIQTRQNTRDINAFLSAREKFDVFYIEESDLFSRLDKVLQFMEVILPTYMWSLCICSFEVASVFFVTFAHCIHSLRRRGGSPSAVGAARGRYLQTTWGTHPHPLLLYYQQVC
jgi:hypothetical protein